MKDVLEAPPQEDKTTHDLEAAAAVKSRLVDDDYSLEKQWSESDTISKASSTDSDDEDNNNSPSVAIIEASAPKGISDPAALTRNIWKLCFGAAGIYAAYLYHGSLEEDLFRYRTAGSGDNFDYVWYLQVLESAACIVTGAIGRRVCCCGSAVQAVSFGTMAPFLTPGASQVFSKAFTNLALAAGLTFPIVVLAKSAKIVPVMLGQLLLGESTFGWRDYLFAALIVGGTALLSAGGEKTEGGQSTFTGFTLIVTSLFMDGITAGLQKRHKVKSAANPPSAYDFLLFTNLSMIVIAVAISVALGEFREGHKFMVDNPEAATLVLQCCMCSAIGQSFIFYIIAQFDPLTCSTITTTRKLVSVLLSICLKGHHLNGSGMAGLGLAVTGLAVEIDNKVRHHHHQQQQQQMKDGSSRSIAGFSSWGRDDDDDKGDGRDETRPLFQRANSLKEVTGRPSMNVSMSSDHNENDQFNAGTINKRDNHPQGRPLLQRKNSIKRPGRPRVSRNDSFGGRHSLRTFVLAQQNSSRALITAQQNSSRSLDA